MISEAVADCRVELIEIPPLLRGEHPWGAVCSAGASRCETPMVFRFFSVICGYPGRKYPGGAKAGLSGRTQTGRGHMGKISLTRRTVLQTAAAATATTAQTATRTDPPRHGPSGAVRLGPLCRRQPEPRFLGPLGDRRQRHLDQAVQG